MLSAPKLTEEDAKRLEQEALAELMNEGKRISQRSRHQLEPEIDASLAPPPRKAKPASAINPISRDPPVKSTEIKKETTRMMTKTEDMDDTHGKERSRGADETWHDVREKSSRPRSRSRDRGSRYVDDDKDRNYRKNRDDARDRDSRRHDSHDKEHETRTKHESRDRDDRRRKDSRDRDDRRRRDSRDRESRHRSRDRDRSRDRHRSARDRSRSPHRSHECESHRIRSPIPPRRDFLTGEERKQAAVKQREIEAKAYLAAQKEAREKGLPIPGWERPKREFTSDGFIKPAWGGHREEAVPFKKRDAELPGYSSPTSVRRPDQSRDRERDSDATRRDSKARSVSKSSITKRDRSTSPANIDRYVPGVSSRHRSSVTHSPTRKRERSRSRDRDYDRDSKRRRDDHDRDRDFRSSRHGLDGTDERDDRYRSSRRHSATRSRSRSHSRSHHRYRSTDRDRDRDRGSTRARSRSRTPTKRSTTSKRDRSRSKSRDRRDSVRKQHRSRSRERGRESEPERGRDRDKSRERDRDYVRERDRVRERDSRRSSRRD